MEYDAAILTKMAERLYSTAQWILILYTVVGAIGGWIAGAIVHLGPAVLIAGGMVGAILGNQRAVALRIQAQMVLVQVAIEANTRRRL